MKKITLFSLLFLSFSVNIANAQQDEISDSAGERNDNVLIKELEGKNTILKMIIDKNLSLDAAKNSCSNYGYNCCCRAGAYGACMDKKDCIDDIGGKCVKFAPGC